MIQRSLAFLLLFVLAACGSTPSPAATAEATNAVVAEATVAVIAETTEISNYQFELTMEHTTPLNWGGTATFNYPTDWTIRDTSQNDMRGEITIYGPDNYNISISINNDPSNTLSRLENVLNTLNQSAPIETVEREGRTIYYTTTRGGNAFAAGLYVDGTSFSMVEMLNTARRELEPMQETAFSILLTVRITAGE